ncbi:MAG: ACP S-malonyltransferase [Kiritimatiellaeota bacterium]|nr:ACP S-malonyltransferase [Kiritimatiellota bacterium]
MKKALFVFSGQGAQTVGMGADLRESSTAAAVVFENADSVLGWSVSDLCFNGPEDKLIESRYCQPAIYTMSSACVAAFHEKYPEIACAGTAGLSLGEFAALCSAGVFDFEEGLKLVAKRGELMDEACRETDGGMAVVLGGARQAIHEVCEECGVDIANHNAPGQIVISGERGKVANAVKLLKSKGLRKVVMLKVAGAYHSRLMSGAAKKFEGILADVELKVPSVPITQNFTGEFTKSPDEIRKNLVSQVSGSVLWENCVHTLVDTGILNIMEFGPGNVLTGLIKRTVSHVSTYNVNGSENLNALDI